MGCKSLTRPADYDSSMTGFRCMWIAGQKPFERDNLRYIERYAEYGNATCMAILGKLYQEGGYGVDQDFREDPQHKPYRNWLCGRKPCS